MSLLQSATSLVNQATSGLRSLLGGMDELTRQQLTDDGQYCEAFVCFFELQTSKGSFLFPLVYAPQQIQISEPYAVEVTPTLDSSLYVEEGGIVQRRISISGSTGLAAYNLPLPKPVPSPSSNLATNYYPMNLQPTPAAAISGPRHFEYLRSSVFRAYSDLKRDPLTARDAKLFLHMPTASEHFQVVPMNFAGARSVQSPFTIPYQIDLLAVGPATPETLPIADVDKGWLGNFRSAISSVTSALSGLNGAINDLTAVQGSFRILGQQVTGIIDSASYVAIAAQNFLGGTSSLINVPMGAVSALFNLCVQTLGIYTSTVALGNQLADWPNSVVQRFRGMMNACDQLLAHPEVFAQPVSLRLQALNASQREVAQGGNQVTVTSFADIQRAGSANIPGDALIASAAPQPSTLPTYRSLRAVHARQGDTLVSIALREMGDGTLWRALALVNGITPPVTGAQGRSYANLSAAAADTGLLAAGQTILIPSTQAPSDALQSPAVLGVSPDASPEEQLLGRDLALVPTGTSSAPLFDLALTQTADGQDLATTQGVANLAQAVTSQVTQTKGANVLYPDVGLEAIVGSGYSASDAALLRFRVQSALTRDPRVKGIKNLAMAYNGTQVLIDAQLYATGLDGSISVQLAA